MNLRCYGMRKGSRRAKATHLHASYEGSGNITNQYVLLHCLGAVLHLPAQHLQKSTSTPTLSLLPTSRPHFTCQQCGFTNTQIPMCLWCCWTSEGAEIAFDRSMPRARRVSAPMRAQGLVNGREKKHAENGLVIDATDVSVMCRSDRSSINRQDRGARWLGHTHCGTEVAEPSAWSMIRLATSGGPKSGLSGDEVNHHVPTSASPGPQATDKRITSSRDAIGGAVSEGDRRQCRREWTKGRNIANPPRKEKLNKSEPEPMSSMQSSVTHPRKSGTKTIGDDFDNDNVLVCRTSQLILFLYPLVLPRSCPLS